MALRDDLYGDVKSMLTTRCGVDESQVTEQTDLFGQLGLDSLDLIGMAQALQHKYTVRLDNEAIAEIHTVGDILAFVLNRMAEGVES